MIPTQGVALGYRVAAFQAKSTLDSPTFNHWRLSILLSLLLPSLLAAEDWPQFRGPNCSGVSTSKKALPTEFSATQNVAWSAEVGDGIGSATVAAGRVFTSGMVGSKPEEMKFVVSCFDAATGKPLWTSGRAITSTIRGGLTAGAGTVFVPGSNSTLYAFGFEIEK